MKKRIIAFIIFCLTVAGANAQVVQNAEQYRFALGLEWTLVKGLEFEVEPQLRFSDGFSYDRFQIEGTLTYNPYKFIYVGAAYRLIAEPQGSSSPVEFNNKYAFNLSLKEKFGRFTPSVRCMYTNFADNNLNDNMYLRYRAGLKYNIRKCKFTPSVSFEAFHALDDNEFTKLRYNAEVSYKIKKGSSVYVDYKFDYFLQKFKNEHIVSVGYKASF
ncbi:MAG: DUF2490 domain-containing protein [bacterium]